MPEDYVRLDREWLVNLCSSGTEFLKELLQIFENQANAYVRLMTSSFGKLRQHKELSDQSHKLKGSASSLGLKRLAHMAQEFEAALRQGTEAEANLKTRAEEMKKELLDGIEAVKRYIAETENKK